MFFEWVELIWRDFCRWHLSKIFCNQVGYMFFTHGFCVSLRETIYWVVDVFIFYFLYKVPNYFWICIGVYFLSESSPGYLSFRVSSGLSMLPNFFGRRLLGLVVIVWILGVYCCLGWVFFFFFFFLSSVLLDWGWRFFFGSSSVWGLVVRSVKLFLSNFISIFSSFIRFIISLLVIPWFWVELFMGLATFALSCYDYRIFDKIPCFQVWYIFCMFYFYIFFFFLPYFTFFWVCCIFLSAVYTLFWLFTVYVVYSDFSTFLSYLKVWYKRRFWGVETKHIFLFG